MGNFIDNVLAALRCAFGTDKQGRAADLGKRPADVALKNNDDNQDDRSEKIIQNPIQGE